MNDASGEAIKAGDIFVKTWGAREMVIMFLPRDPSSAKNPYLRLHTGTTDAGYWFRRGALTGPQWRNRKSWRYVGRVPDWFLHELLNNYDW